MRAVSAQSGDAVVLDAAGSSADACDLSVPAAARSLSVVRLLSLTSRGVVVASYLLATGHFHWRILAAGADLVTAPLLDGGEPDPRLVELVRERFVDGVLAPSATPRLRQPSR